jgi:hypothetical protein
MRTAALVAVNLQMGLWLATSPIQAAAPLLQLTSAGCGFRAECLAAQDLWVPVPRSSRAMSTACRWVSPEPMKNAWSNWVALSF